MMLHELEEMVMRDLPPIDQTFFYPSEEFLDWLVRETAGYQVVEVGCGQGLLVRELVKRGVSVFGLDPRYGGDVLQDHMDGVRIIPMTVEATLPSLVRPVGKKLFVLVCRPAHTGFTETTARILRKSQHRMVYVSKPENRHIDLGDFDSQEISFPRPVGKQNEVAYEVNLA